MAIIENSRGQFQRVTPATIKPATRAEVAYRRQIELARAESARVRSARRAGYRGPLTRAELAAKAGR
jgi:hypothetical protein